MSAESSCFDLSKMQDVFEGNYPLRGQIYHTLMPFRIREILIVSSLYDAFIIEEEGLISELVIGEYHHLLLSSPPRVTRVFSGEDAISKVKECKYDLVITMSKNIGMDPFYFGEEIKKLHPDLPVILLAADTADLNHAKQKEDENSIDKIFFWNGDPTLFLAIIKSIEDRVNAPYDTVNGNVRVLILIDDSVRYYSMLLPIIYTEIVQQTRRSLSEDLNEMQRLLRRRARPKILLAKTFEEGIALYNQYKENVLGVITDVHFKYKGKMDQNAGYKLVKQIKKENRHLPILMQSSEIENKEKAEELDAYFLSKNSPTIVQDFQHFLLKHLGFGDFVFLLSKDGRQTKKPQQNKKLEDVHILTTDIARASNMKEFEQALQNVPLESIKFHADRNHFSNWLMARCEFKLAMRLRPLKTSDFTSLDEARKYLVQVFNETRREKQQGAVTDFSQQKFEFDSSLTRLRGDSLGGKGRGIAFIRSLVKRYNLQEKYKNIRITVPSTVIIGTLEFDRFILDNNLLQILERENITDDEIKKTFLDSKIHDELKENLHKILQHFRSPLAVRSSSLLEDSQNHPFAGIYSTYMLPNNHEDDEVRLQQLGQAIKLVYASAFFKEAKAYIESTASKLEEEKMAIVLQEVIGNDYKGRYYPTFSGVAQSYNFYPVSHQTYEDGIASVAVGLGIAVVGGEKVLRFSPRYPNIIPDFSTAELILENSQRHLYVLNITKKDVDFSKKYTSTVEKVDIADIRNDGALDLIASTYDRDDRMIRDGLSDEDIPLITFAGILKYDEFPLATLLQDLLTIGQRGMGCPVEIEFAVTFDKSNKNPPTFAVLQIRPFVISKEPCEIIWDESVKQENVFIHSDRALGNGVIDGVKDVVYVPPDRFDSTKTLEIAKEVDIINKKLTAISAPYILIGPGRWGTQDRWLGMPVRWSQISGVKVMVETALEDFNIKPSQGTHFFQNIISRGIGYINIPYNAKDSFIDWKWLTKQKTIDELKFLKHVRLFAPLTIKLDGRSGQALIMKPKAK